MRFPQSYTLEQIATILDIPYVGSPDFKVLGMNEIHVVTPGDIVFVDHPKYYDKALESAATVILINKKVDCPEGKALLISEDPFRDFNKLTAFLSHLKKQWLPLLQRLLLVKIRLFNLELSLAIMWLLVIIV